MQKSSFWMRMSVGLNYICDFSFFTLLSACFRDQCLSVCHLAETSRVMHAEPACVDNVIWIYLECVLINAWTGDLYDSWQWQITASHKCTQNVFFFFPPSRPALGRYVVLELWGSNSAFVGCCPMWLLYLFYMKHEWHVWIEVCISLHGLKIILWYF